MLKLGEKKGRRESEQKQNLKWEKGGKGKDEGIERGKRETVCTHV